MSTPRPVRRRPAWLAAGLLLLLVSVVPAWMFAEDHRSTVAMDSARTCPAPETIQTGCRSMIPVRITAITSARSGKAKSVHVAGPAPVAGAYEFHDDADVLDVARVGDEVTAEVWDGRVVALRDLRHRSLTSKAPQSGENTMLALALLAFTTGLALVARYTLRDSADARFPMWADFTQWRSVAYRAIFVLSAASLVDVWLVLESGGTSPLAHPLVNVPALFVFLAAVLVFNEVHLARRRRPLLGVSRRARSRPGVRSFLAYASIVLGLVAALASAMAAFTSAPQGARDRAAARAASCSGTATENCLSTQWATVWGTDLSGDEPAVVVEWSLAPARWVYFTAAERDFVRTLTTGQLVGVKVWHGDVVSVSPLDASRPVPADLSYDDVPAGVALVLGVVALAALALGIRGRRPWSRRHRVRRLRAEVPAVALFLTGALTSRAGTWWPYLLTAAFVVICLPLQRVHLVPPASGVEGPGAPGAVVRL